MWFIHLGLGFVYAFIHTCLLYNYHFASTRWASFMSTPISKSIFALKNWTFFAGDFFCFWSCIRFLFGLGDFSSLSHLQHKSPPGPTLTFTSFLILLLTALWCVFFSCLSPPFKSIKMLTGCCGAGDALRRNALVFSFRLSTGISVSWAECCNSCITCSSACLPSTASRLHFLRNSIFGAGTFCFSCWSFSRVVTVSSDGVRDLVVRGNES